MQSLDDLLRAERQAQPDGAAEARNWAAIEHRLTHGPPPPPAAEAAPTAFGAAAGLKLVAGLAVIAAVGGLLAAGGRGDPEPAPQDRSVAAAIAPAREDSPAPPPSLEPAVAEAPSPEPPPTDPGIAAPTEPPTPAPTSDPAPPEKRPPRTKKTSDKPPAPDAADTPPAADDFAAELQLLAEIRGALKRGDPAGALTKIDEHARRFARGQLVQERMASQVEALCGLGRVDDARRVASQLLERWPDSTHAPRVRASCVGA